jgi:hypothetical protein
MKKKKYNSVFELSFSIDHHAVDGSDITPADFEAAVRARLADIAFADPDWSLAVEGPFDTYGDEIA